MPPILTRPQSRPLPQTLLLGLVVLGIMIVGVFWVEGYVRDQYVNALQICDQVAQGHGARSGQQVDSALNDGLLIFGFLAILLAPMGLALAETGPGGAVWKLLTFLCCFTHFARSTIGERARQDFRGWGWPVHAKRTKNKGRARSTKRSK